MSERRKVKAAERQKKEARQAKKIVNGIFIALVALMVVCIAAAALLSD